MFLYRLPAGALFPARRHRWYHSIMRIYLTSLGCKLNQAEIASMAREILARGHQVVDDPAQAHWAIINTCTVTHIAARKSRQMARSLHRRFPELCLALTGCYADMSAPELAALAGVDLVVANRKKDEVVDAILATVANDQPDSVSAGVALPARLDDGHTRAFVKVQDGCDNRCTYCIVTVARGPARSMGADGVVDSVRQRVSEGYREIVLTGINIGAWGRDLATQNSLAGLVRRILVETGVERLRLSSIEPPDLTPELLSLWADPRLCRHVHLPLQSGCDATLRGMARQYNTAQYAAWAARLREGVPEVSLTTDLIVGFPGESEQHFEASYSFVQQMGFARLHVFKYSSRPGTRAAEMSAQIAPDVAQDRSERMIALGQEMGLVYHQRLVGQSVVVLAETSMMRDGQRIWNGLTDTYVRVSMADGRDLGNKLVTVHCQVADAQGVAGSVVTRTSEAERCPPLISALVNGRSSPIVL